MNTYRVAVLRGGPSEEYDVSMKTGAGILSAINRDRYIPLDVIITRNGEWLLDGRTYTPADIISRVDAAFIALHGTYGEDGTVQRLLERHGVPYTGSRPFPSSIALNKVMAKDRLSELDIRMPQHFLATAKSKENIEGLVKSITNLFGPRYVVKPMSGGSSIGTQIAHNPQTLFTTLKSGLDVYDALIVEELIIGKEATCGVINNFRNQEVYTLPVVEIVPPPETAFFDYEVKYNGKTEEICPGRFTRTEKEEMERVARVAHEVLELSQYSRSDFMVSSDRVYFLEVNTLPGMTAESLLPKALRAVGCTYEDFVDHLLKHTLKC